MGKGLRYRETMRPWGERRRPRPYEGLHVQGVCVHGQACGGVVTCLTERFSSGHVPSQVGRGAAQGEMTANNGPHRSARLVNLLGRGCLFVTTFIKGIIYKRASVGQVVGPLCAWKFGRGGGLVRVGWAIRWWPITRVGVCLFTPSWCPNPFTTTAVPAKGQDFAREDGSMDMVGSQDGSANRHEY